jgi:mRNA-degrading endonuclease YafQ of YafQ-DinJ toxin-antitoxin module
MNERLLLHAISAIFSAISWRKLHTLQGDDDDVRGASLKPDFVKIVNATQ